MRERYLLKADHQTEWTEVTKEQFINAEYAAGFRSKFGFGHLATSGFGGKGISGRVETVADEPIGPRDNESLSDRLTRITAQRNRYWEQVEVLTGVLRKTLSAIEVIDFSSCREGAYDSIPWQEIEATLAAVAEESEGESDSKRST